MINLNELAPRDEVPHRGHPHEQLELVLRGVQILSIDGVVHGRGGDPGGCLVIDVFDPVREDYRPADATPVPLVAS